MRTVTTYVAAAALAVSGLTFVGCDRDEHASTTTTNSQTGNAVDRTKDATANAVDKTKNAAERAGDKVADVSKQAWDKTKEGAETAGASIKSGASKVGGAIADVASSSPNRVPAIFGEVTNAALTKQGLNDIVERFVDADRNRIGKTDLNSGNDTLNGIVDQISKDWQAKDNDKIDILEAANLYNSQFMTVAAGELGKDAAGASVDVNVDKNLNPGQKTTIRVDENRKTGVDNPNSTAADTNRNDPGRNVATASIMASHGMPALTVPLIHEAGGWKIDVPDSVDGATLRQNLIDHLTMVKDMKDQWPSDRQEAERAVTHHVLMAVMNQK